MALRRIFTDDAPCLHKIARPVEHFDERLHNLLDDMADTLHKAEGVGLAAPQIGINRRVFIIDCGDGVTEMINPEIIESSGEQGDMEGCLSYPGQSGYVVRPKYVTVRAFDRDGVLHEYKASDLFARAIFHENDHLDGNIYLRLVTDPPEGFDPDAD